MFGNKKEDYQDWVTNNLKVVPCHSAIPNCSACIFRNAEKMCSKMSCTYMDEETDDIEAVYWVSVKMHANVALWPELVKYFDTMSIIASRNISQQVVNEAFAEKKRGI